MPNRSWTYAFPLAAACSFASSPADIEVEPVCECLDKLRSLSSARRPASEIQVQMDACQVKMNAILDNSQAFQEKYGPVESAKLVSRLEKCGEDFR